jgi:hypothetical protein
MHGGLSPGAPKGNKNALKHGLYTAEGIARRREISALMRAMKALARNNWTPGEVHAAAFAWGWSFDLCWSPGCLMRRRYSVVIAAHEAAIKERSDDNQPPAWVWASRKVLRLMISSSLVGNSTGRSPGLGLYDPGNIGGIEEQRDCPEAPREVHGAFLLPK